MPLWKIANGMPRKLPKTDLKREKLLEEHLEDWIVADPSLLEEPLLIIGRQVCIPEIRDRLDILAVDPQGNTVIIELKRGKIKDPADMQALRYASYISKWQFNDFEKQARAYLHKEEDPEFNFNELYEQFCNQSGVEEAPDINLDQRLMIVGAEVKDKLGSVALWLREHSTDIKVIELNFYADENSVLVYPQIIIPLPVSKFNEFGHAPRGEVTQPWLSDGRSWHLEKMCSPKTREMLLELDDIIRDNLEIDGPHWKQKHFVAYRIGNFNWLTVHTRSRGLELVFSVKSRSFSQQELARGLAIKEFDKEDTLAEKIGLPSSIQVEPRNDTTDFVKLRIKEGFNLRSNEFIGFLKKVYSAYAKN